MREDIRSNLKEKGSKCVINGVLASRPDTSSDVFCKITGYGGTTQDSKEIPRLEVKDDIGIIKVRFNSDTSGKLNWYFQPVERQIVTSLGKSKTIYYEVKNNSPYSTIGTSTFNVTPQKAGIYFNKLDCFCYEEYSLSPGETALLPVRFFINPDIRTDPNTKEIKTITLSYTFFDTTHEQSLNFYKSSKNINISKNRNIIVKNGEI